MKAALLTCIPPEVLPEKYGGSCPGLPLENSEMEADLHAYVASMS